jgi:putative ABC transport system permease protein
LTEQAEAIPGVTGATLADNSPPQLGIEFGSLEVDGLTLTPGDTPRVFASNQVDPGYFRTLGVPILAGRSFDPTFPEGEPDAVIINDRLARRFWPRGGAVGGRIRLDGKRWLRIVGVAGTAAGLGLGALGVEDFQLYHPFDDQTTRATLLIRGSLAPDALTPALRTVLTRIDPAVPTVSIDPVRRLLWEDTARQRLTMTLLVLFAVSTVVLTGVGLHGVLRHTVEQRHREIGIRLALGASPGRVRRQVVTQGILPVALGAVAGLGLAVVGSRLIESQLFGIDTYDPLTYGLATLGVLATALIACWVPARQATRVDPVAVMRSD